VIVDREIRRFKLPKQKTFHLPLLYLGGGFHLPSPFFLIKKIYQMIKVTKENLNLYIKYHVSEQPVMTTEETHTCLLLACELKDENAVRKVFNSYARFVISVIERFEGGRLQSEKSEFVKAINIGNKALVRLIKNYYKFDAITIAQQKVPFMSTLVNMIAHKLQKEFRK